ncbi:MAG: hypothetical protein NT099_00330 [Candidatus Saganbacteria bacterium]|nr:hypothetical protein [Candidatus Saganbacteria bacterium]
MRLGEPVRVTLWAEAARASSMPQKIAGRTLDQGVKIRVMLESIARQITLFKGIVSVQTLERIFGGKDLTFEQLLDFAKTVDVFLNEYVSLLPLEDKTWADLVDVSRKAAEGKPEEDEYRTRVKAGIEGLVGRRSIIEEEKVARMETYPLMLIVFETPEEVAARGAELFKAQLTANPFSNLGLATGSSQLGLYSLLVNMPELFRHVPHFFNLDEYVGLVNRKDTYYQYMRDNFFRPLGIGHDDRRWHIQDWLTTDPTATCVAFEKAIRETGVQLQLFGLGPAPSIHMAFCVPDTPVDSPTHVVSLDERTLEANSRCFMDDHDRQVLGLEPDEDPHRKVLLWKSEPDRYRVQLDHFYGTVIQSMSRHAMNQGVGTALAAERLLMNVTGPNKELALLLMLSGRPTIKASASLLRLHRHAKPEDFTILADVAAARRLPHPYNRPGVHIISREMGVTLEA